MNLTALKLLTHSQLSWSFDLPPFWNHWCWKICGRNFYRSQFELLKTVIREKNAKHLILSCEESQPFLSFYTVVSVIFLDFWWDVRSSLKMTPWCLNLWPSCVVSCWLSANLVILLHCFTAPDTTLEFSTSNKVHPHLKLLCMPTI